MIYPSVAAILTGVLSLVAASPSPLPFTKRALQPLPLSSSDRWIVDANGKNVPYVGINWPGAADAMLPEGLQYQSVADIVSKISSTGFNVVRLTFAIEMVDDILDNGGDVSLSATLATALGADNGTIVLNQILAKNPSFTASTTRLQVFDAVAAELAAQNIYLHLDNHVSKAMWCCSLSDGNSWFGDTYFDTTKWVRGLTYMATHGKANWPSFSSVGLRNELRLPTTFASGLQPYSWSTWKTFMTQAADSVHSANSDVLIFLSGLDSDFNIEPPVGGSTLDDPAFSFTASGYAWAHKMVYEMHEYDENISGVCAIYETLLDSFGANAITKSGPGANRGPLVFSEWGYAQADAANAYNSAYASCLRSFMVDQKLGWMMWVLAGSYYIRTGTVDSDESYGLLDHTWDDYRGSASLTVLKQLISDTYAAYA